MITPRPVEGFLEQGGMRGDYFDCEINTMTPIRAAIPSAIMIQ